MTRVRRTKHGKTNPMFYVAHVLGIGFGGLKHTQTYYVTLTAVNKLGLMTTGYSNAIVVDDTPPRVCLY